MVEQCVQFVPRKQHFVGIFYLDIFPNKMSVYIRLRCRNQSTIRREIFTRNTVIQKVKIVTVPHFEGECPSNQIPIGEQVSPLN